MVKTQVCDNAYGTLVARIKFCSRPISQIRVRIILVLFCKIYTPTSTTTIHINHINLVQATEKLGAVQRDRQRPRELRVLRRLPSLRLR